MSLTGQRINYVLGGPVQAEIEGRKISGEYPRSDFNAFVAGNDAKLVGTERARSGSPTSLRRRMALAWQMSRETRDYDVLVTSGEDIGFPLALASLARRVRRPIWIVVHGSYLSSRKFALIAPLIRRAGHVHFLCLSESLRRQMVDVHGFPADRCHNAGYGVDTSFFRPAASSDTPLVLSAGSANRDYQTLIAAVDGLDVPLRIAADSLWRPKAADLGAMQLPANVDVGSAGGYTGLRTLYERASFVVVPLHPARFACGYAVIAEAMAMGKAVVTTRTEAPSDFVVEGETGFYVEAGDVGALRDRIRRLLDDTSLARRMGQAGAARMQDKFSLDDYCKTIERVIRAA